MKEYKVVSKNDSVFSGKFSPESLEKILNTYATSGWVLVTTIRSNFPSLLGGVRESVSIILEREK
jgi:hypothetical protein